MENKLRKICVLTGTRAEFGVLRYIIKSIKECQNLELSIIAAGMHMSKEFGESINEIKKEGFDITATAEMIPEDDTSYSMSCSVGHGILNIAKALKEISPDILLVIGDRTEALAGALAAAYMNIIIAHISGGDITRAGLDESVRHAITKIAHIHFPSNNDSAKRIIKMGEDEWRVFMVGAPCIDIIKDRKLPSREDIEKKFSIDLTKPLLLVLQHSVSTEPEEAEAQITKTLEAVTLFKHQTIIIYPNSDAGGRAIIKKIREYESLPFVQAHANLSQDEYYALLKYASILIGNSSSGVIETPSFRLPVINIGIRQEDRARANNVIDCMHNKEEIAYAIKRALSPEFMTTMKNCISPYGEGGTAEKIVEVLRSININKKLLQKKNTY